MSQKQQLTTIGRAEEANFPELGLARIPARIDTGAKTSAIWATHIKEADGHLEYVLFNKNSKHYNGQLLQSHSYEQRAVASSNGSVELRYTVKLLIELESRKIRASFTLANRASQVYPVLIGRNILRGKFIVNVKQGRPDVKAEQSREKQKLAIVTQVPHKKRSAS